MAGCPDGIINRVQHMNSENATAADVVVLGQSAGMTALAESLRRQYSFNVVSDVVDAPPVVRREDGIRSHVVFIAYASSVTEALYKEWVIASAPLLVLGTHTELKTTLSLLDQPRREPDSSLWRRHVFLHHRLELFDFVQLTHADADHLVGSVSEIALRIRKLAESMRLFFARDQQDVHDSESGRLNATKIAETLGVPLQALAKSLQVKYTTLHKTPDAISIQNALGPYARTIELLQRLYPGVHGFRRWLNTPHRELDERTPLQVMLDGKANVVRNMLEAVHLGLPT